MPHLLTTTCQNSGIQGYNFKHKLQRNTSFTTFCNCFVWAFNHLKENFQIGFGYKFTFEVIP